MPIPASLLYAFAFLWGAIWGSFLNVCIYRMPAGISIVRPASRCPTCGRELKAWHNVPILSWLLLRGRCAFCRTAISARYPLVELLMGVLSVAILARVFALAGPEPATATVVLPFVFLFAFVAALVVITFIDIDHLEIPNVITLPGVLVGVVFALVAWPETGVLWWHSLLGAVVGGGVLLGVIWGYFKLTGREGMGLGDFKLMAMVGAFLGVQALPYVMFASAAQGLLYALALFAVGGGEAHRDQLAALDARDAAPAAGADEPPAVGGPGDPMSAVERFRTMPIPFGPFIALGAIEWVFFGDRIAAWLESWLG